MDFDGDAISSKPINSTEAVEEAREYHNNLLSLFDYTGDFSMKVGKCAAQTCYTFSREPKPKDKSKTVDSKHEFIQYILNLKDSELDINTLYKWTSIYGSLTKPILSIYDTTTIKRNGKSIDTTIGQLIINKVIFGRLWNNSNFEYVKLMTEKKFVSLVKHIKQMSIEGDVEVRDLKRIVDMYCEFTLRVATIYNAGCTAEMLNTDAEFKAYRDKCFDEVRDEIIRNSDIHLLEKTINKVIEFAKVHYKDNDMIELYESGGKSNWNGDFAAMQIALGGLSSIASDKPEIVLQALSDGIPFSELAAFSNAG